MDSNQERENNKLHGIIAVDDEGKVLHLCCYLRPPTENDFKDLEEELLSDEEFGIQYEDWHLMNAPEETLNEMLSSEDQKYVIEQLQVKIDEQWLEEHTVTYKGDEIEEDVPEKNDDC